MNVPTSEPERRPATVADQLARDIKRRRDAAGLSQRQLAAKVRYTRQYVGSAEAEDSVLPSRDLVSALDAALGADGALIALRAQARDEQRTARARTSSTAPQNTANGATVMLPVIVDGRVVSLPLDPRIVGAASGSHCGASGARQR
ncbi:ribosome-binding protein aMBF1 (putative translation factor) [Nocardia sp. GAS34]|uniref:helix-turn-helix domain-containing protein n=1 Tax=unclassified Nocardia TaxID=2637762 RepID=UPI003D2197F2